VDSKLANQITKRHRYFLEQGMEPIWFIEKKEQSIEKDKNGIVLWDAELTIAAKTNEDKVWDSMLGTIVKDKMFFNYFNYPVSMENLAIDVRSMYYIYSKEDRIVVKVQRFLKDRIVKPYRAFLLNDGYEIPFAEALVIRNEFILSSPNVEEQYRKELTQKFQRLQFEFQEQQRIQKELRQLEEEQRQKLMQEKLQQEEERRKKILQQVSEQKSQGNQQLISVSSYDDLKLFLKERIGLTQSQQMELWTNYLPKIGYKNSNVVWELFVEHDCKSFKELRIVLRNFILIQNK
jgi:hypothetical protein